MPDERSITGQRSKLPERVLRYWRLKAGLTLAIALAVVASAWLAIGSLPLWIPAAVVAVVAAFGAGEFASIPVRYRTWWFTIGEEQIDLERGVVFRTHTVIPMTRVQHVELEFGPLARRFSLAELQIHTAAGSITIPALDRADGEQIRQRIADLARIADDL